MRCIFYIVICAFSRVYENRLKLFRSFALTWGAFFFLARIYQQSRIRAHILAAN